MAPVPRTIARLGSTPACWAWPSTGSDVRHHAAFGLPDALPALERIAVPKKGRALPLLRLAYERDNLSPNKSRNQIEQEALLAVVGALPMGVRPVILADRGFRRASFIAWLKRHHLDYVVRIKKGSCITEKDGKRWKLGGEEGLKLGGLRLLA
jgi:Transposase DDE domain